MPDHHLATGLTFAVAFTSVSFFGGILFGLVVLISQLSKTQARLQQVSLGLWILSFVFWGACIPSAIASMIINKRRPRQYSCCSCGCTWIYILGFFEMSAVFAGYLTCVILDGSQLSYPYFDYWNQISFTLVIGLPTVVASILMMGLPRVLISNAVSKEKSHDDSDLEHTPLARDERSAPPPPVPTSNSAAPIYYTPHPNVQWDGPSGGAPSNLPPGYSYQGGPNAVK